MRLQDLPKNHYFVVINPEKSGQLLVKDSNSNVRTRDGWQLFDGAISADTEVQPVHIKKSDDHI